ncbi:MULTISPECIES: RagB/SusD family nutrient uptake outer membrane protein [Bacteroides]|uniref:RagB/SusD family nutrient uptake outer membrane protein n=1 Tax=Bacteroides TaxID=816 RepID=UPI00258EE981|nr:RagB/SusD family nutrient uptake outer membrane protein [Bacteroides sp.]
MNRKYILLMLFVFVLGGCQIKEDDDEKLPGDKFWNEGSIESVESFMLSIYSAFRDAIMMKSGMVLCAGDLRCAPVVNTESSTDYIPTVKNGWINCLKDNDIRTLRDNSADDSWYCGAIMDWSHFYKVIQSCNILEAEIGNVPGLTETDVVTYKAEAVFMRNLTYFFLVRLFGDVPYYTNAYNAKPLPRTDMVTVLKNCLSEMQTLIDMEVLPWTYTVKSKKGVRANRGGAIALMMHINLWLVQFDSGQANQYYRNVVALGNQLINNNGETYSLLPLESTNEIFKGGSAEGLFEVAQNIAYNEVFKQEAVFSNNVMYTCFSGKKSPTLYYSSTFLRKIYPLDGMTEGGVWGFGEETDGRATAWFLDVDATNENRDFNEVTKFKNVDTYSGSKVTSASGNQVIFRLADAILMYAEALYATGNSSEALIQVNKIRTRANAKLFDETMNLESEIYWERVRELIGEGFYFYDLVRTGKLCDRSYAEFSDGSGHYERRANFNLGCWTWPIAKKALGQNPYMSYNLYWE